MEGGEAEGWRLEGGCREKRLYIARGGGRGGRVGGEEG